MIFYYPAVGSAAEELSREGEVRVLVTNLSEEIAADGGDRNRTRLLADFTNKSEALTPMIS